MATKTLKTKRVFAWAIFSNLKNMPPKDFPTTGEIRSTINTVLPALKEQVPGYLELMKKAEDLSVKVSSKEISEEVGKAEVDKINEEWKAYNKDHANDVVEIALDDEGLKVLKEQFEREDWGRKWIATITEFGELLESFAEAAK